MKRNRSIDQCRLPNRVDSPAKAELKTMPPSGVRKPNAGQAAGVKFGVIAPRDYARIKWCDNSDQYDLAVEEGYLYTARIVILRRRLVAQFFEIKHESRERADSKWNCAQLRKKNSKDRGNANKVVSKKSFFLGVRDGRFYLYGDQEQWGITADGRLVPPQPDTAPLSHAGVKEVLMRNGFRPHLDDVSMSSSVDEAQDFGAPEGFCASDVIDCAVEELKLSSRPFHWRERNASTGTVSSCDKRNEMRAMRSCAS